MPFPLGPSRRHQTPHDTPQPLNLHLPTTTKQQIRPCPTSRPRATLRELARAGSHGLRERPPLLGRDRTYFTPCREMRGPPVTGAREADPQDPCTGLLEAAGRHGPERRHRPQVRAAPRPPPSPCDQLPKRRAENLGGSWGRGEASAGRSRHVTSHSCAEGPGAALPGEGLVGGKRGGGAVAAT